MASTKVSPRLRETGVTSTTLPFSFWFCSFLKPHVVISIQLFTRPSQNLTFQVSNSSFHPWTCSLICSFDQSWSEGLPFQRFWPCMKFLHCHFFFLFLFSSFLLLPSRSSWPNCSSFVFSRLAVCVMQLELWWPKHSKQRFQSVVKARTT